jgi:Uma2 family endonuclease
MTVEAFDAWTLLPEQMNRAFEYVDGEIIEVPSNPYASQISQKFAGELYIFLKGKDLGHLTGEAGGYKVSGERYAPEVGFVSKARQAELDRRGYNEGPPDLAIEVDYPSTMQSQGILFTKIVNYLAAGTVVWRALPETKTVEVYVPGQPKRTLGIHDTLDGGEVLAGFRLAIRDIFGD